MYFWGDGVVYPSELSVPEKVVHIASQAMNGLLLTENNNVFTYDIEEFSK